MRSLCHARTIDSHIPINESQPSLSETIFRCEFTVIDRSRQGRFYLGRLPESSEPCGNKIICIEILRIMQTQERISEISTNKRPFHQVLFPVVIPAICRKTARASMQSWKARCVSVGTNPHTLATMSNFCHFE